MPMASAPSAIISVSHTPPPSVHQSLLDELILHETSYLNQLAAFHRHIRAYKGVKSERLVACEERLNEHVGALACHIFALETVAIVSPIEPLPRDAFAADVARRRAHVAALELKVAKLSVEFAELCATGEFNV